MQISCKYRANIPQIICWLFAALFAGYLPDICRVWLVICRVFAGYLPGICMIFANNLYRL